MKHNQVKKLTKTNILLMTILTRFCIQT